MRLLNNYVEPRGHKLEEVGKERPRLDKVRLVPGQQAHGVARGPGLRPDEAADHNNGKEGQ